MNKVIGFGIDEDGVCSVEVIDNLNEWNYLGYMVNGGLNGMSDGVDINCDDWEGVLDGECKDMMEGMDEDDVKEYSVVWNEFKEVVRKEMDEDMMVVGWRWSVEYDKNISVMLCKYES